MRWGLKRVRRLLRAMGLMAVYPKPRLSLNPLEHKRFPYLLKGLAIVRPNQVWSIDITYIRLRGGFVYPGWRPSTGSAVTCWLGSCRSVWKPTSVWSWWSGPWPPSDRRSSTAIKGVHHQRALPALLLAAQVRLSMDGRGRAFDNIFVERLWCTVKDEEVYLKDYRDVPEARHSLGLYFPFYNDQRIHQSLAYRTPQSVHFQAR